MEIRQIIIKYYNDIPDIPKFLTENDNRVTPALKFSLYQVAVSEFVKRTDLCLSRFFGTFACPILHGCHFSFFQQTRECD